MNDYVKWSHGEKIRVVFVFQDTTLFPAWESFYRKIHSDNRFEIKTICTPKPEYSYKTAVLARDFLADLGFESSEYSKELIQEFKPHFAFLQTPYDYLGRHVGLYSRKLSILGARVGYIPYGIEIVDTATARFDHFRTPVINNAYRIYVLSDEMKKEYQRYCGNYENVRATGLPRFDILTQKERFPLLNEIKNRANGRKIVLWHAHFTKISFVDGRNRQVTPDLDDYIKFAKEIKNYDDLYFVFLPHPKFGNDLTDPISNEKSQKVIALLNSSPNGYVDRSIDYRPSMLNCDAFITDRSSLMIEAGILNVPILLLYNKDYQEPTIRPLKKLTDIYYHGTGYKELKEFVNIVRTGEDERKEIRLKTFNEVVPHTDGKCAERIIEDLYDSLLNEGRALLKVKPKIIIFGAGYLLSVVQGYFDFDSKFDVIAFSDNNSKLWGTELHGKKVIAPHEIQDMLFDKIIITVNSLQAEHIYRQLRFELEIPANKIEYCEYLAVLEAEEV